MASWGIITINGIPYDCTHLDSFVMSVTPNTPGALSRRVLVAFGHHCFTRELRVNDPPEMVVHHRGHNGDPRCFCTIRYGHSLNLRAILETAKQGMAYFGETQPWRQQNYLLIENLPGLNGPYAIFFDLKKSTSQNVDVVMLVNSAYPKPKLQPARIPKLPFRVMVATVAAGGQIVKPKK